MTKKTLPKLESATGFGLLDILLCRRVGQTKDEKLTGSVLLEFLQASIEVNPVSTVAGLIQAGNNIEFEGEGTSESPYIINSTATGGGGGAVDSVNGETGAVVLTLDSLDETSTRKHFTDTLKTKLDGITAGATVNSTDAHLLARANHTGEQAISTVTGLQTALDGKAASAHSHAISGVTGLQDALDAKAASTHDHAVSEVTGLQDDLDAKQGLDATLSALAALDTAPGLVEQTGADTFTKRGIGATNSSDVLDRASADTRFAAATHAHTISNVTGLQTALDAKATPSDIAAAIAGLVDSSPGTMDTLNELAAALGDDPNFATTITTLIATKQASDATLTALAALNSTPGLVEQTGADAFTKRPIGTTNSTDILDRAGADARFAPITHSHAISEVTGLQTALDGKAASTHGHAISDVTGLQTALDGKATSSHTHTASQITDFTSAAAAAAPVASVAGKTGSVTLAKGDVGLGNVDNTADASKPVSTAAQTALDAKAANALPINTQTASYTLLLADATKYVRMNNASALNLTVPANATVAFPDGTQIPFRQAGAGQVTVVAAGGVTINTPETLKLRKQGSTGALVKVGTDEWDLTGDLEEAP